ncbi:MAG: hypothetical protein QXS72_09350 [Candidatus Caldarchaeum sp.]
MSLSLLSTAVVAIAVYFGMPLIQRGLVLEGFLLIVLGMLASVTVEYLVSKMVSDRTCVVCGGWMRKVQGLYYCENCRRFYELRRVKGV